MFVFCVTLIALNAVVGLIWTTRHLLVARERRDGFLLTEAYPGPPPDAPQISVVVAAKDEADNIETCVRTMLAQDYPNFELIVCNDRSSDETGAIVERIAGEDSRVRLINITELPDGWCGKNHAMQNGIASARSEWICMIDADCRQTSTRTLSTAMQYAIDSGADLLSVLPTLEMRGFWENVVQPVCGGVMMIWFNPDRVNDPDKPQAYANGAFMLMKKSAYRTVGTHESVRDRVNEDMHLAARTKAAGLNLRVVRNRELYVVRMYTSLKQIVRGWGRIFFGTFGTLRRISISLAVLVLMGLLPYATAVAAAVLAATGAPPDGLWTACALVAAIAAAIQISVIYRFYKLIGARQNLAWSYVIGCAAATVALCVSLSKLRKGAKIVWRNTNYASSARSHTE